jgi:peptidoglycan/LPS O-acetylase OafA/YrhL
MKPTAREAHPAVDRRTQLPAFDLIRGLAATAVLVGHYRSLLFEDFPGHGGFAIRAFYLLTGLGHQAVIVFFVLSGFFVGGSVLQQVNAAKWSWRRYLLRRLTRLYVVLLPALALTWLLDQLALTSSDAATRALYHGHGGSNALAFDVAARHGADVLLGNLCFLQTFVVKPFGSNGPLWSLAYEFWYYLIFPCLWLAFDARRTRRVRLGYAAATLTGAWFIRGEALSLFLPWLLGAALAATAERARSHALLVSRAWVLGSALLFGGSLLVSRVLQFAQQDLFVGLATAPLFASIAAGALPLRGTMLRLATSFGAASFSIYAFHFPIVAFAFAARSPAREPLVARALAWAALELSCVFAALFALWWLFERHTETAYRTLSRRMRVLR